MPKISVIIPVYKVEEYLDACLKSVERQTFQDFELILVDDGSPDRCGEICDRYADTHANTRVIHQKNMGLSEARNQGVQASVGEYVVFIDSDDYVSDDYLEYLYELVQTHKTEVAMGRRVKFWDNETPKIPARQVEDRIRTASEALIDMCYNKIDICAWGKIYRRNLMEKYPYPAGQLYEDTATTYKIFGAVDRVACGSRIIYYWRQRRDSITHASITERHFFGITAAKEQVAYMHENYPEAVPAARARCAMKIVDLAYRLAMGKMDKALFEKIRGEMRPLCAHLLNDKKAGISLKVRSVALCWGFLPFKALSVVYTALQKATGRL